MKTIYGILMLVGLLLSGTACHDEGELTPEFEYAGPFPAIADGPSVAQKICYELYQKYDHHVYYTLSGEDALRTLLGKTQVNGIEHALPMEAGDEATAEAFLKLLKTFYAALPEEMVKSSVLKRHVLVKKNVNMDLLLEFLGIDAPRFLSMGWVDESAQGVVYWGEIDDELGPDQDRWKYSLILAFFTKRQSPHYYTELPVAKAFGLVSAGKYMEEMSPDEQDEAFFEMMDWETFEINMDYLMELGFVNPFPFLFRNSKQAQEEEMAYYVTWIACTPLEERQEILEAYPLVKKKYDLTIQYYKDYLKMDLEAFSKVWSAVELESE